MIEIKNLKKRFNLEAGFFAKSGQYVYAVNDITFTLHKNQTYGLVGESGCGKSTTAKMLVQMYQQDSGSIIYTDKDGSVLEVGKLKGKNLKDYREKVKYIFQDPAKSLNPRMSVYQILTSGYKYSKRWPGKEIARNEAGKILEEVGLSKEDLERRPSDFSGGQRQRISIARALLMEPEVLICDEVVSALDVSIQGQILNLLQQIREKRNISMLFIAHDLKVSCYFCDKIGVMYKGVMMEEGIAKDLYKTALHPYTKLLFASVPGIKNSRINGEIKTAHNEITGCPFAERCPMATTKCFTDMPPFTQIEENHNVRCWHL